MSGTVLVIGGSRFTPGGVLGVALLAVRLVRFRGLRPALTLERSAQVAFLSAAVLVAEALMPNLLASARFGPPVVSPNRPPWCSRPRAPGPRACDPSDSADRCQPHR